jgi:pilus assembly protein CpaB
MNQRLVTILITAFLIAGGASYVVYRLVGRQINMSGGQHATAVVVAARDLDVGTIIKPEDVRTGDVVGTAPKDAVQKVDVAIGRGVVAPIYSGEPVIEKRLAPAGSGGGLAATIPPGMRACAVKVNDVVGLAGFVLPGMRVDVLVSGSSTGPMNRENSKVKTLLQNIEVLSAGKNFQRGTEGKPIEVQVVNLLVTPEQAELLSLANNETRVQLVLRNPLDREMAKPPGTELAQIFGSPEVPATPKPVARPVAAPAPTAAAKEEKKPPAPAPKPVFTVQVSNGSRVTESKFEVEGEAW